MSLSRNLIDNDSLLISSFYDRFPYPPDPLLDEPPPGFNWRWSLDNVFSFCTGALPCKMNCLDQLNILDAGCGSGVSTDYLSHLNPGARLLAVDISSVALQIAKERLARSGGDNKVSLRFQNISFLDLEGEAPFDYINSVGALHHLKDPLAGLKALGSLLKDNGILHLFIYADHGRWEIRKVQKALRSMEILDEKNALQLARKLINNLPENNRLRRNYQEKWSVGCHSDINFADTYLHPRETTYNLQKLWQLIANSNLEFLGFSNPNIWSLDRLLHGELLDKAKAMSPIKQMELVEDLDPDISHFEFFLSKKSLQKHQWANDDDLLHATGRINSCLWGWPGMTLHDSDMNQIELNSNSFKLLKAIDASPGKPFGLLPLDWDQSMIASTARDLQKRQLLLLYPL